MNLASPKEISAVTEFQDTPLNEELRAAVVVPMLLARLIGLPQLPVTGGYVTVEKCKNILKISLVLSKTNNCSCLAL